MAQILDVNSLIYIENGNNGTGWYIIPAGNDIESPLENGIFVEVINSRLTYTDGLPVSGILDIYLIYTPEVVAVQRLLSPILTAIDTTQNSEGPVKILLTNDVTYSDYEFPTDQSDGSAQPLSKIFILNRDVPITSIDHSEHEQNTDHYSMSVFNVAITFQNRDGTIATWTINQAEAIHSSGENPAQTTHHSQFKIGTDGPILTAREFIAAYQEAAPYFDVDSYIFTIDENQEDVDFTQAVTASNALNLDVLSEYKLEGAPQEFSISSAGIISFDGDGLDHETAPEEGYGFKVVATAPNGLTATANVTVFVGDV